MSKLHVFDMDGTLMSGSACLELSRRAGQLEPVLGMEEAWSRGQLGHLEFYEALIPLWRHLDEDAVTEAFTGSPWLDSVDQVFADIAMRGEYSAVISMSPQFFVDLLIEWGANTAHGAAVVIGSRPNSGVVLYPEDKVRITQDLLAEYGLGSGDCVAYGDASSDIPLFEHLPHSVAVNASPFLREMASAAYEGNDLSEAYALGRSLLSRQTSQVSLDESQPRRRIAQ